MKQPSYNILIVDDEDAIKNVLASILSLKGHKCSTASDGIEALSMLADNGYDVMIVDIVMPNMDGITLTKEALKINPEMPIMVMTGFAEHSANEAMEAGAWDFISKPFSSNEFLLRFYKMMHNYEIIRLAIRDPLSGVFNRKKFYSELTKEIKRAERYGHNIALVMFDIDWFKEINDKYGHQTGDHVLQEIVKIVETNIRKTDVFCRYGGDEFVILMPETNIDGATHLAEKLKKSIEQHEFEQIKNITCSFGVSEYIEKEGEDSFIKRVDTALYNAKNSGRNSVEVIP